MTSLDDSMIDAYTIAIEQDVTDEDRAQSEFTAGILDYLAGFDTQTRQEAIISIAGDLAFAFNGVVMAGKAEVEAKKAEVARLEQERIDREVAEALARQQRRREEIARQREQDAGLIREAREERAARYAGQEPACGFPNCTLPECYDGTYANRNRSQSMIFDGWSNLGYTDEAPRYISAPAMNSERLADWERELLRPRGFYYAGTVDAPVQPIEDPVLGTGL